MITQKLRDILKRHSSLRQPSGENCSHLLVIGKRMVVGGCEAIVCLASRKPEERRQGRVVLHGVGPGDVIRAPARFFNDIVKERRLPGVAHCRLWQGKRAGGSAWVRPRVVPCPHHAEDHQRPCTRCPWMGLATSASREIKAERLRRAIESILLSSSSLCGDSSTTKVVERKTSLPTWSPSLMHFLEPFDIPLDTHSMREMEFYFQLPLHDESSNLARGTTAAFAGRFCFSLNSMNAPNCFLCTLEQQRLLVFLNRWAERLPSTVQQCLRAVFILQHSQENVAYSWERDLHLTLLLRQGVENIGEQSPLCGPSQSGDTLCMAEQQLVDAVLSALPLTKRLGIVTVCSDGSTSILYPCPRRVDFTMAESLVGEMGVVQCNAIHGPSGRTVTAKLPFMHSSVASALGTRDMTALELFSPSVWRHMLSLEAAGSLLLSALGDLGGSETVVLLADQGNSQYFEKAVGLSRSGGLYLLSAALSQWLGSLPMMSVVHVTRRAQTKGKCAVDLDGLRANLSSAGGDPTVWFCLVDSDADIDAMLTTLQHGVLSIRPKVCSVKQKRVVIVQLAADGNFNLLATAVHSASLGLEGRYHLSLDAGVVDIDPWTAVALGYVVLKLSAFS